MFVMEWLECFLPSLPSFSLSLLLLCVQVFCLPICLSTAYICLVPTETRRGHQIPLDLELGTVVSHHVSAGS